jgi:hypothetical protein
MKPSAPAPVRLATLLAAVLALASPAARAAEVYYETFDNFTGGGPGTSTWGTNVLGNGFFSPFGPAAFGFAEAPGYVDDAAKAVSFSSHETTTMQAINAGSYGLSAGPYALSFALKVDDSDTTGTYAQVLSLANAEAGFRTITMIQLLDQEFFDADSYIGALQVDNLSGNATSTIPSVGGILEGANGFVDDGSAWNFVFAVMDPANTTLRLWVNPASAAAAPDLDVTTFSFGSAQPPTYIGLASFVFAPDTAAGSEKTITVDSVKLFQGGSLDDLFAQAYNSYSTLGGSSVGQWQLFE